jgi:hypothetical protein
LGQFLAAELNCRVEFLGIQPAQTEFDTALDPRIDKAVDEIVGKFSTVFM